MTAPLDPAFVEAEPTLPLFGLPPVEPEPVEASTPTGPRPCLACIGADGLTTHGYERPGLDVECDWPACTAWEAET